jgi:23S rRNA (uracil1939-C5)-methyltransferase
MSKKQLPKQTVVLDKIVGGGQALGTLEDGRKLFVWGGLPGETVDVQLTKRKSHYAEGIVTDVLTPSSERLEPLDPESYLSTSPWQIMTLAAEQHYKAALIEEAFELHDIVLPEPIELYTDGVEYHYRNKVEFSWYGTYDATSGVEKLDLAFHRRGSKGKIPVDSCSLLPEPMLLLARSIRDFLQHKGVTARQLKTLLIRQDSQGSLVWQLYIKDEPHEWISTDEAACFSAQGGEVIYSDPRSPASVITKRLLSVGDITLRDSILGIPFRYAARILPDKSICL